jgi:hypothetical protein
LKPRRVAAVAILEGVGAGVFIDLELRHVILPVQGTAVGTEHARMLEIKTGQRGPGGTDAAHRAPAVHAVVFHRSGLVLEGHARAGAGYRHAARRIVAQPQRMAVGAVFIAIKPAQPFPVPVQQVMLAFLVLAKIADVGVRAGEGAFPVAHQVMLKHLVGEFRGVQAVEGDVIVAPMQPGQPGSQQHLVEGEAAVGFHETELEYITVEVAQAAVFAHQFHRRHLARHILERDGGVVRQHLDPVAEIARQAFAGVEAVGQHQRVGRAVAMGNRSRSRRSPWASPARAASAAVSP